MKTPFLLLSALLMTTSCGFKVSSKGSHSDSGNFISGIISPFVGQIVDNSSSSFIISSASAAICTDPVYAKLFRIQNNGSVDQNSPLVTQLIGPDARYKFDVKTLDISNSASNVQFLVVAEGCNGDTYKRPITNFDNNQNMDAKSTVIGEVVNANSLIAKKLNEASRSEVQLLINTVSGSSTTAVLNSLTTVPSNTTMFTQVFGSSPSVIYDASPEVKLSIPSTSINELAVSNFSINAFHVDPSYSFAYSWKLDGVVKSTNATWSYIPGANDSGNHSVDLYVGKNDGSGHIDVTKPYYTKSAAIIVNNNILPTTPDFLLNASNPTPVNSNIIQVNLSTGVTLSNCSSFSHLAITDTASQPGIMQFNIDCTTNGTQVENVTFTSGDGAKTLYLWAIDNEGNISSPKTISLMLDSLPPVASIIYNPTLIKGGTNQTIALSASDNGVGLSSLKLYFSSDNGSSYSLLATLANTATTYTWSAPLIDTINGKLKLVATDLTSSATTVYSSNFMIDSSAPSSPGLIRTSNAASNSTTVAISTTCTADYDKILYSQTNAIPSLSDSAWETCASSKNFVVSAGDGLKTIYAFTHDAIGNISSSSNVTMTLDTIAPIAPVANLASASVSSSSTVAFTITDCLDRPRILVRESIVAPLAGDSSWQACSTSAGAITYTLVGPILQGSHTLYIYALDSVGNVSASTMASMTYDTANPLATLGAIGALRGGSNTNITYTSSDASSGVQSLILEYAANGTTFTTIADLTALASPYVWTVPSVNLATAKLRITATDNASNSFQVTSSAFTIDSIAPALTQTTFTSGTYTHTNSITFGGSCETGLSVIVTGAESLSVACPAGSWSFTTNKTSDENYGYIFTQTDAVGNSTNVNSSWVRDATAPILSLTAPTAAQLIQGGTAFNITWTATDDHFITNPIALQYSSNGGTNWTSITAAAANTGTYSWTVPSLNSSTVKIKITGTDLGGNTTIVTTNNFVVDSTAPILALTSLTGGQVLRGGQSYSFTWTATDNNFNATPVRLDYSIDAGVSWIAIATGLANSGNYTWVVPSINSSSVRVKVSAADMLNLIGAASSTSNLIIDSINPSLTLNYPTGSQTIKGDAVVNIAWTASDANFISTPILIEISSDGGSTYSTLASNVANTGSYAWTVSQADKTTYRIRITAIDSAGNSSTVASTSNLTVTRIGPNLAQTGISSYYISNSLNQVTYSGSCDLSVAMTITTITVSGTDSASVNCTGSAPTGSWTWTTPAHSSDGIFSYTFTQANTAAISTSVTATWVRDTTAPVISATAINDNAVYSTSIIAAVKVTATDTPSITGLKVRVVATTTGTDCQSLYQDSSWQYQVSSTTTYGVTLPSGDGVKKVCVWAKDQAGNIRSISPTIGTMNVDMDEIILYSGSVPTITAFSVTNNSGGSNEGTSNSLSGDAMLVTWSMSSTLGLDNDPVRLEYTTDNTNWIVIESAYGGLSGNPTSYTDSYVGFTAPTSSFFRVRILAKDMAGNYGLPVLSNTQNTGNWSIYAGGSDRGVGRNAKAASLTGSTGIGAANFAVAPNNDIYTIDYGYSIKKISSLDGNIYDFILHGTTNLGASGTLTSASRISTTTVVLAFDHKGLLYVLTSEGKVYQINLTTNAYSLYAGGGNIFDATATATTVNVAPQTKLVFDESNSLYFFTNCDAPAAWNSATSAGRLLKLTQNANGSPGSISIVAGNCTRATPTYGQPAVNQPLNTNYISGDMLAVWNNGNAIYFRTLNGTLSKIINGKIYTASLGTFGNYCFANYSGTTQKIYVNCGDVRQYTPSLVEANNGEVLDATLVSSAGTGDCLIDGISASLACEAAYGNLDFLQDGTMIFTEGLNTTRKYRLRYVDKNGKIQTIAGTLPFYGIGKDKSVATGTFGSIYYKKSTEPNLAAFPEGLYFTDYTAPLWGRIETNNLVSLLWGTQRAAGSSNYATGTLVTPTLEPGAGGAQVSMSFSFDSQGLPWIEYNGSKLVSLDNQNKIVRRTVNTGSYDFATSAPGTAATAAVIIDDSTNSNLTLKNSQLILLGRYYNNIAPYTIQDPVLRLFDYTANNIVHLMGNNGITSSADVVTPGSLTTSSISSYCVGGACRTQFIENNQAITTDDLLYWAESNKFRVIKDPTTPGNQTLTTVFTAGGTIQNFIVNLDQSQVYYARSGLLYCHALTPAGVKTWCNDSNLGPSTGLSTIASTPNQYTWKDANTLLISSGAQIYQFNIPQIP